MQKNKKTPQPELRALTGLRAFASLWIVLTHYVYFNHFGIPLNTSIFDPFIKFTFGIDIFFILSGFILAYSYYNSATLFQPQNYYNFLVKRLARLYPMVVFTLFLMLLLKISGFHMEPKSLNNEFTFFINLFFLQSFLSSFSWNIPAWAVSTQFISYLFFPYLLTLCKLMPSKMLFILMLGIITVGAVSEIVIPNFHVYDLFLLDAFLRIALEFNTGLILGLLVKRNPFAIRVNNPLQIGSAIVFVSSPYLNLNFGFTFGALTLFLYSLSFPKLILSQLFASRPFYKVGTISFSIYLIHFPIQVVMNHMGEKLVELSQWQLYGILLIYLNGLLLISWLCYTYIEQYGNSFIKKIFSSFSWQTCRAAA